LQKKWFFTAKKPMVFAKKVIFYCKKTDGFCKKSDFFCQVIDFLLHKKWCFLSGNWFTPILLLSSEIKVGNADRVVTTGKQYDAGR
jgi:hypothetical protein